MKAGTGDAVEETEVDKLIGKKVQKLRTDKDMSQAQLAQAMSEKAGHQIHQQTVLKIEKGTRPLRYYEAMLIAEALGVSVNALTPVSLVSRERQNIDIAWLEAADALAGLSVAQYEYLEAARKLATVIHESPNIEKFYSPSELELMRWHAEGEYVKAVEEARRVSLATMPDIPDNGQRLF